MPLCVDVGDGLDCCGPVLDRSDGFSVEVLDGTLDVLHLVWSSPTGSRSGNFLGVVLVGWLGTRSVVVRFVVLHRLVVLGVLFIGSEKERRFFVVGEFLPDGTGLLGNVGDLGFGVGSKKFVANGCAVLIEPSDVSVAWSYWSVRVTYAALLAWFLGDDSILECAVKSRSRDGNITIGVGVVGGEVKDGSKSHDGLSESV